MFKFFKNHPTLTNRLATLSIILLSLAYLALMLYAIGLNPGHPWRN